MTACGERLTPRVIGVANRTLPCGTRVAIYWQGRTIVVPVIDRGPFANHADWDLTEATGRALRMPGTETIGAVSLPAPPRASATAS
jgi:rare lipoprotein A (peptidoglycan hydrolase)